MNQSKFDSSFSAVELTLKHTIGLNNFHSKKREHILQEIFARIILYNFVEAVVSKIVISKTKKKHDYQVNFANAVHVCRRFLRICEDMLPCNAENLIRKNVLPIRTGRSFVRKPKFKSAVSFVYRVA